MRTYLITIIMLIGFCGCILKPGPSKVYEAKKQTDYSPRSAIEENEQIGGVISLHEAIAHSIKNNFNRKINTMEKNLAEVYLNQLSSERLPELVYSSGYGSRNSSSGSYDISTMWNIMDICLSAAAAHQNQGQVTESLRSKVFQNIIQEVRYAYYRAASAQNLLPEADELLQQSRAALQESRDFYGENSQPPRNVLEHQRQLIENVRLLWDFTRKMTSAKAELAALMNLNPGTRFDVFEPDWNRPAAPSFNSSMSGMDMEHTALTNRPDLKESGYRTNAGVYETRKAILKMQPGLDFDSRYDAVSSFDYNKAWWDAGLQISQAMLDMFSNSGQFSQVSDMDNSRGLLLNIAVVTQMHLARLNYAMAKETYRLSCMLGDVNAKLNINNPGAKISDKLESLKNATDILLARMRKHEAFTEMENAADKLYNSIGFDLLPPNITSVSTRTLSSVIKQSLTRRISGRSSNDPFSLMSSENVEPERREGKTDGRPIYQDALSPKPELYKTAQEDHRSREKVSPETFTRQPSKVTNAGTAQEKGQQPVKEVAVYRDVVDIHFQPSIRSPVKGQGLIGEKYRLLGWAQNGWLKIEMGDGSAGWIPTKYIKPVESSVPAVKNTQVDKKRKSKSKLRVITTKTRANVRTGPGLNFNIKFIAGKGVRYKVKKISGEWFKILTKSGKEGWVHKSVVR